MKRILFVDDEPNVLQGLQRMLRPLRREWDMAFVAGGSEALQTLEGNPCDIIVSDMRMPGMDGVLLLGEVKRCYPESIRIALSGHSEMEMLCECTRVTHQYLAKPCDPEMLKTTVDRAIGLQALLSDDKFRKLVANIDSLPSLPKLYTEIMEELSSEDGSIGRVAEIIAKDVGMTTKVLQVVNSAFFGLVTHVASPAQAAMMLGVDTIRGLVLSSKVFSQFEQDKSGLDLAAVQHFSERSGALARRIAMAEGQPTKTCDHALMAGMLQDVGQLVLANHLPGEYAEVARAASASDWEAEQAIFGCSHMEVGAYLLGIWGLPNPIVEAVAHHHCPGQSVGNDFSPLTAVHIANVLLRDGGGDSAETPGLDLDYLQRLGLHERLPVWRELYAELHHMEELT